MRRLFIVCLIFVATFLFTGCVFNSLFSKKEKGIQIIPLEIEVKNSLNINREQTPWDYLIDFYPEVSYEFQELTVEFADTLQVEDPGRWPYGDFTSSEISNRERIDVYEMPLGDFISAGWVEGTRFYFTYRLEVTNPELLNSGKRLWSGWELGFPCRSSRVDVGWTETDSLGRTTKEVFVITSCAPIGYEVDGINICNAVFALHCSIRDGGNFF